MTYVKEYGAILARELISYPQIVMRDANWLVDQGCRWTYDHLKAYTAISSSLAVLGTYASISEYCQGHPDIAAVSGFSAAGLVCINGIYWVKARNQKSKKK